MIPFLGQLFGACAKFLFLTCTTAQQFSGQSLQRNDINTGKAALAIADTSHSTLAQKAGEAWYAYLVII